MKESKERPLYQEFELVRSAEGRYSLRDRTPGNITPEDVVTEEELDLYCESEECADCKFMEHTDEELVCDFVLEWSDLDNVKSLRKE